MSYGASISDADRLKIGRLNAVNLFKLDRIESQKQPGTVRQASRASA